MNTRPTIPVSEIARPIPPSRAAALCAALLGLCAGPCPAAVLQWTGVNGTFWSDETNWEPPSAPRFNGRYNDTIFVNGSSELVYDSSLGETVFGSNTEPGFRIGAGTVREPGTLIVTGGRLSSSGAQSEPDQIGEHGGQLLVKGGVYETGAAGLVVGSVAGKGARFDLKGGLVVSPRVLLNMPAGTLRLDGGVLATNGITLAGSNPLKTEPRPVHFNGGVIRTSGDITSLFTVPQGMTEVAEIHAGGVTFDTGAGKVVLREGLQHAVGPAESAQDGGLVKEGDGDLFLVAMSSFNGDITVNRGILRATKGRNVLNPSETCFGNAQTPRRQIYVNSGGVLCLSSNDVFGSVLSDIKTTITVNAGGLLTNQYRILNYAYGIINRLGPIQLNGGTLRTEGGANVRFQSFSFGGPVRVGGTTPSHINATDAPQAKHLGFHLSSATSFEVADASRSADADLFITAPLINQPPAGSGVMMPGGLVKQGPGTLRLGEANLHTGVTEVKGGTLELEHSLALQFSQLEVQPTGRLVLLGQGRTFWLGGVRSRGDLAGDISAGGNRLSLSPSAVSEFTLGALTSASGLLRVSGGDLVLDGKMAVRLRAKLPAGTHVFRLLNATALSGAFRDIAITGSYVVEGPGAAPLVDAAGNSFTFDPVRGEMTVVIR
jgi:autotransporter-associated beta strand protein